MSRAGSSYTQIAAHILFVLVGSLIIFIKVMLASSATSDLVSLSLLNTPETFVSPRCHEGGSHWSLDSIRLQSLLRVEMVPPSNLPQRVVGLPEHSLRHNQLHTGATDHKDTVQRHFVVFLLQLTKTK